MLCFFAKKFYGMMLDFVRLTWRFVRTWEHTTWMSRWKLGYKVSKWVITPIYPTCNPFNNHLLTSWDIQVHQQPNLPVKTHVLEIRGACIRGFAAFHPTPNSTKKRAGIFMAFFSRNSFQGSSHRNSESRVFFSTLDSIV